MTTFSIDQPRYIPKFTTTKNRSHNRQKLLIGDVIALTLAMIAENLFETLIRSIWGELVGLAANVGENVEVNGAILRGVVMAAPALSMALKATAILVLAEKIALCCLEPLGGVMI
jgi:hypothetical protein